MNIEEKIKFQMAEQVMLETVFEHADEYECAKLATEIAQFLNSQDLKAQTIVAAIYMLHSTHVKETIRVLDEKTKQERREQIPPWMQ